MEKQKQLLNNLREIAKRKRISQIQISEKTGIDAGNVSKMLSGKSNPSLKKLISVADAIGAKITIK